LLAKRQQEIKDLQNGIKDRDAEIERLKKLLGEKPKQIVQVQDNDEWRIRFEELQRRHRRDIDNYEDELNRKDGIIMDLRDKLNQRLTYAPPVQHVQAPISDDKDALISKLRTTIGDKDNEIFSLMSELKRRPTVEIVPEHPKAVHVVEPNMREVRYEKDPYLVEQNARLMRELEAAVMEEQNAKQDLSEKIKELNRLQSLIADLRSMPPKVVYQDKIITKEIELPGKIGDRADRLLEMQGKHMQELQKRLAQDMLYYYAQSEKWKKLANQQREKVLIQQKLEVIDGTFDVWVFFREHLVDWLFGIFVRSADRAAQRTMNSFLIFKCNLEDIRKGGNDFYSMMVHVYARLKNLIYDDIPKIIWEEKYKLPNPLPKDKLLNLSPEAFKKLKANQDIRDNINEWVEDTLFNVILRKQYDVNDKDKHLLYLYRLLAIKYRVTYPIKGESFQLDQDLKIVLESKICNAALAYFTHGPPITTNYTQKRAIDASKDLTSNSRARSADMNSSKPKSRVVTNKTKAPVGQGYSNVYNPGQPQTYPYSSTNKFEPSGFSSDYLQGGQQQANPQVYANQSATSTFGGPKYFGAQLGDANLKPTQVNSDLI
jgi:hypothetical protein